MPNTNNSNVLNCKLALLQHSFGIRLWIFPVCSFLTIVIVAKITMMIMIMIIMIPSHNPWPCVPHLAWLHTWAARLSPPIRWPSSSKSSSSSSLFSSSSRPSASSSSSYSSSSMYLILVLLKSHTHVGLSWQNWSAKWRTPIKDRHCFRWKFHFPQNSLYHFHFLTPKTLS